MVTSNQRAFFYIKEVITIFSLEFFGSLLQIIFIIVVLGAITIYVSKKTKKNQLFKKGENEIIELRDGIYLNNQTSAFLFEVEGNKIFTVVNNNGIQSIKLQGQDKKFEDALAESIKNTDYKGRDNETNDEEI